MAGRIAYLGNISPQGLVLDLDAAIKGSYPKTGSTWFDISNNGNNGTLTNGPLYTGSNYGAIVFDGSSSYVLLNKQFMADASTGSFDVWFNLSTLSGSTYFGFVSNVLIGKPSSPDNSFGFYPNTGKLQLRLGNVSSLTSSVSVSTGSWQLGQGVWNSTGMSIYQNGSPVANVAVSGLTWFGGTTYDTVLGRNFVGSTNGSFTGQLGNVKIYNQALTQFQVWQNFNAYKSRYGIPDIVTDGLVLNLDAGNPYSYLSGSSGTTWTNVAPVSSSISGTLTNGPVYSNGAITFDGVDDYIVSSPPLVGSTDITIIVWFKSLSINTEQALYDCNYPSNGCLLEIYQSKPSFQINTNYIQSTTILSSNQIYCVAVSKPNNGTGSFYVNAVNAGSTISSSFNIPNSNVRLGAGISAPLYPFNGSIYNTQIYNRALTQTEITQNFNALRGRYGI